MRSNRIKTDYVNLNHKIGKSGMARLDRLAADDPSVMHSLSRVFLSGDQVRNARNAEEFTFLKTV